MIILSFKVPLLSERIRIFDYLRYYLSDVFPSKNSVKKAFKKELILLNGQVVQSGQWLFKGDYIEVLEQDVGAFKIFPLKLEVVFEDEFMAVIYKPSGFAVSGNFYKTIQNALPFNLSRSKEDDALAIPRPLHRLDKLTSGLLLIAKTRRAQMELGRQFENQRISKTYKALVKGNLEFGGRLNTIITHQNALTIYSPIRSQKSLSYDAVTLVQLQPITGRTHQLRIHMASLGHPIVGDVQYDDEKVLKGKGLFLTACKLSFSHPISHINQSFESSVPAKFDAFLNRELRRWNKFKA